MIKKIIRGVIKIPVTPFVVVAIAAMYSVLAIMHAFEWLYEASEYDLDFTKAMKRDLVDFLKKWFTTV